MTATVQREREAGLTMTEVLVVSVVMSLMMVLVTESMTTLSGVRIEQRAHFRLGEVGDRVARRIEDDISMSTRVFGDNARDLAYLQAMAIGPQLLSSGRVLPRITDHGHFDPDPPVQRETGNMLFLSPRGPRVAIQVPNRPDRLVQTLRFVVYAPVATAEGADLLRWFSEPTVVYWDIADIADPNERADTVSQLHAGGVRYAWDPQSPRSSGLYELTAAGGIQPLDENRRVRGREDASTSRPFGSRAMQLAQATTAPQAQIPLYAAPGPSFDCAFEVKIDGTNSGKLVLLRFVVASTRGLKRAVWSEVRRLRHTSG